MSAAFALIEEVVEKITEHEKSAGIIGELWFRGQADSSWPLLPGVLRADFASRARALLGSRYGTHAGSELVEREINSRFQRRVMRFLLAGGAFADTYSQAQHHGLPTRLLDWTTNLLVALFFACQERDERDAAVFTLSPAEYYYCYSIIYDDGAQGYSLANTPVQPSNPALTGQLLALSGASELPVVHWVRRPPDEWVARFEATSGLTLEPSRFNGVLPVIPNLQDERMMAQHSCFTFHPPNSGDITPLTSRIVIPAGLKPELRVILRKLGTTRSALFGGTDGAGASLVDLIHEADRASSAG